MKDIILDTLENLKYFLEDNWQKIAALFGIISLVVLLIVSKQQGNEQDKPNEGGIPLKEKQEVVQDMFTMLEESNTGTEDKVMMQYKILIKKPLASQEEYQTASNYLIDLLKYKYNTDKSLFLGMKADLYDRLIEYDENLLPVATMQYSLKNPIAMEKEFGKDFDNMEIKVDKFEVSWNQSYLLDKKTLDYKNYSFNNTFSGYDTRKNGVMSNEEFQFFIKLNKYYLVTDSWDKAISKYLQWERGLSENVAGSSMVVREYMKFIDMNNKTGGLQSYYSPYDMNIKAELLVKNPNWLYYILDGVYETDEKESLRQIVSRYPEYKEALVSYKLSEIESNNAKEELINSINELQNKGRTEQEKNDALEESLNNLQNTLDKNKDKEKNTDKSVDDIPTKKEDNKKEK